METPPIDSLIESAYKKKYVSALGVGPSDIFFPIGAAFPRAPRPVVGPRRRVGRMVILGKIRRRNTAEKGKRQYSGKFAEVISNEPNRGGWVYVVVLGKPEPIAWRNNNWTLVTDDVARIVHAMPSEEEVYALFDPLIGDLDSGKRAKQHLNHLSLATLTRIIPLLLRFDPEVHRGTKAEPIGEVHYLQLRRTVGHDFDTILAMAASGDMRFMRASGDAGMKMEAASRTGLLDYPYLKKTVFDALADSASAEDVVNALVGAAMEGNKNSVNFLLALPSVRKDGAALRRALDTAASYGRENVAENLAKAAHAEMPSLGAEPAWTPKPVMLSAEEAAFVADVIPPFDDVEPAPPLPARAPPPGLPPRDSPSFVPDIMFPRVPSVPDAEPGAAHGSDFVDLLVKQRRQLKKAAEGARPSSDELKKAIERGADVWSDAQNALMAEMARRRAAIEADEPDKDEENIFDTEEEKKVQQMAKDLFARSKDPEEPLYYIRSGAYQNDFPGPPSAWPTDGAARKEKWEREKKAHGDALDLALRTLDYEKINPSIGMLPDEKKEWDMSRVIWARWRLRQHSDYAGLIRELLKNPRLLGSKNYPSEFVVLYEIAKKTLEAEANTEALRLAMAQMEANVKAFRHAQDEAPEPKQTSADDAAWEIEGKYRGFNAYFLLNKKG